jgi:hypothetical protein
MNMQQGTYLSALKSELYDNRKERFAANRMAQLLIVMPGLAGLATKNCQLVDVCLDGAGFKVPDTIGLPLHYYVKIAGIAERMGCAEINRNGDRIGVKFLVPLKPKVLREIIRSDFLSGGGVGGTGGGAARRA